VKNKKFDDILKNRE